MMEGQGDRDMVCRGRVLLHMSDTVWLDRCQVMVRQPTLARYVCTFETVSWLVNEGLATPNTNHMELLYKLADKAGIPRPEVESVSLDTSMAEEGVEIKTRTAFLPLEDMVTVYMSECVSPSHFYLHRVAHMDSLDRLEKDITDWAKKENLPNYSFRPKQDELVIVRPEWEISFFRARVTKVLGSRQMEGDVAEPRVEEMFKVFFVDTGMTADVSSSNMAECKMEFVDRLPFQAIRCSLAQVGPVDKEWSSEAGDRFFDMTRDLETDEAAVVECIVVEKTEDEYRVKLRHGQNLAQDLVQRSLAEWLDSSLESSIDSLEDENERDTLKDDKKEDPTAADTNWDIPNGLPEDVLNMKDLYAVTKEGCEQYLEDQLGPAPVHQQFQPPPTNTRTVQTLTPSPARLSTTSLPPHMPSLAIVTGLTSCQTKVPHMVWSQDHQAVSLRVTINSMRDISPSQVFVGVKQQELTVQILEVDVSEAGELYTLHQTPGLQLFGEVDPNMTKVKVMARGLTITLVKQRSVFWMQLSRQKFGWIKKDPNHNLDSSSDSDSDPVLTGKPEAGFISSYLGQAPAAGAHGKRYHPLTGEEILPETMWQSSDQESEEEELGFINDRAIAFNPNIL
eukprot:GFUD01032156.1.p1 GENE.GFUD01032156.1~~GFUD01032156.1.p1  ORF type:complete len:620 (+),score=228.68 GFUD01032156.1:1-1860(+)